MDEVSWPRASKNSYKLFGNFLKECGFWKSKNSTFTFIHHTIVYIL